MPVISGLAIVAGLLVVWGIIRLSRGHKTEGSLEILGGLIELVGEILAAFL
jgi:hypothetical protein